MKQVELAPIRDIPEDFDKIEEKIIELFRREIYLPIVAELGAPKKVLKNSTDDLLSAISSGRISYRSGAFEGKFDAASSRELKKLGAVWDRSAHAWKISKSQLSVEIKNAISASSVRFEQTMKRIQARLDKINPAEVAGKLNVEKLFDSTLWKIDREFKKTLKGITVVPELTESHRAEIARDYTKNMELYIKEWIEKDIVKLRGQIEKRVMAGDRHESMIKMIQKNYGVSQSKAKFLARQETNLMLAKFKKTRYEAAGVNEYRWTCVVGSANHPVRPIHKALDGKVFTWENPPITDEKGNRNNPGEDYGCRCFARPIVKFNDSKKR